MERVSDALVISYVLIMDADSLIIALAQVVHVLKTKVGHGHGRIGRLKLHDIHEAWMSADSH